MKTFLLQSILGGFIFLTVSSCNNMKKVEQKSALVWLELEGTRVGILPAVGGRIVHFSVDGCANILKSDPKNWDEADSLRPKISAKSNWKEYNGHIVWLGPQSEWWVYQD
jgi:hypothetical protein